MFRAAIVAAVLLLASCRGSDRCPSPPEAACRYEVRGACVMFDPEDPPQLDPAIDVAARLERGLVEGAGCWDADPDALAAGLTLVISEHAAWLDGELALGAASAECRMIYVSDGASPIGLEFPGCVELMLPHELGHLVIPEDHDHADPRWACAEARGEYLCEQAARNE